MLVTDTSDTHYSPGIWPLVLSSIRVPPGDRWITLESPVGGSHTPVNRVPWEEYAVHAACGAGVGGHVGVLLYRTHTMPLMCLFSFSCVFDCFFDVSSLFVGTMF